MNTLKYMKSSLAELSVLNVTLIKCRKIRAYNLLVQKKKYNKKFVREKSAVSKLPRFTNCDLQSYETTIKSKLFRELEAHLVCDSSCDVIGRSRCHHLSRMALLSSLRFKK